MAEITEHDLQKQYLALMKDTNLDRLELELNEPNIFSILAIDNMEIRHSNFLAWLLNPKESHGLNDLFLKRFLREIFFDKKIQNVTPLDAEMLDYRKVEIRREWHHIDLLISFPNLVICLENKVWSKDNGKQLTEYKNIIQAAFPEPTYRQVFLYLTPYGETSSHETDIYSFISYRNIITILDRILNIYQDLISTQAKIYINDYIKSLKRNIMGNDKANEMARDIYRNHKKLIDYIFANRPNAAEEYAEVANEVVKAEGFLLGSEQPNFVRFLPASISEFIPKYSKPNGWTNAEGLLFEIHFRDRDVLLKLTASPSIEPFKAKVKELLLPALSGKKYPWEGYYVLFEQREVINYKDTKLDRLSVERDIKSLLQKLKPTIDAVEEILLAHKDELIALKQQVENK
ncbi:PD-(D/E)XK nuclease family protein [Rufibacter quisquiliarum]|uniref:PD-(D/E)XK nuclease superfamily protein n=1 Tax=Rufibacter quisquiliarum TaxID=1549639 RepID=A0A839GIR3_9BACT|nr:PD-(D/E)XK nuclease family protein [Rufibacter quisquiliarum]MBA9078752.1 hypothetical protein [Rufibacter quisquiliarum]